MDNDLRKCLQCSKQLTGRLDKRFCDSYCRNTYNNRTKRSDEQLIKQVNQQIRKNRRVLKTLSPSGKAVVRREVLENLGFDFNYFSSLHNTKSSLYYLCYDYGFRAIVDNGKEKVQIIQLQDYMTNFNPWKYVK